jgi:hypothetical protein
MFLRFINKIQIKCYVKIIIILLDITTNCTLNNKIILSVNKMYLDSELASIMIY